MIYSLFLFVFYFVSFSIYYSHLNQSRKEDVTSTTTMASSNAQGRPRTSATSGSAPSTVLANGCAKKLSAAFRRTRDLPPIIHPDEIAGENAEFYFNTYFTWCATRPVPHAFNAQLLPTNPDNRRCANTDCLLGYIYREAFERDTIIIS